MKQSFIMKRLVSTEYLIAAILVALFYVVLAEFDWWWLPITFFLFDLSAVGYLLNAKIGALTYNLGHSLIGPGLAIAFYIATESQIALFIGLLWLFHIFVDRALGYGLKHTEGFQHTHLGKVGKVKKTKTKSTR